MQLSPTTDLRRVAVYRYGKREHINQLLTVGRIRIGTLNGFREAEARGIKDATEGTKFIAHYFRDFNTSQLQEPPTLDTRAFQQLVDRGAFNVGGSNFTISNLTLSFADHSPNLYVLCFSSVNSKATMAQFEGYDACARIVDPLRFFRIASHALNRVRPVRFLGFGPVKYREREEQWNGQDLGQHPAFIKERIFAPQCERRAVWEPLDIAAPLPVFQDIEDRRLAACCVDVTPT